jgi:hypothetical protein
MTLTDIDSKVSEYTNTTSTTYTGAKRLINLNLALNEIQVEIWKACDEWDFDDSNNDDFPVLTTDLILGQQDYGLETYMKRVKRLEISYDGTNWVRVKPFNVNESDTTNDTTDIANHFTKENPYYDTLGSSILIYPIPDDNITDGLKIWVDRDMYEFESETGEDKPGFDSQFHRAIPMIMAREWFMSKDLPKVALYEGMIDKVKADIRNTYSGKQQDRKYMFTPKLEDYS